MDAKNEFLTKFYIEMMIRFFLNFYFFIEKKMKMKKCFFKKICFFLCFFFEICFFFKGKSDFPLMFFQKNMYFEMFEKNILHFQKYFFR